MCYLNVLAEGRNSLEYLLLVLILLIWYVTLYARISPFGSSGTSQIILADVNDTSGNDTFEGAPGTKSF